MVLSGPAIKAIMAVPNIARSCVYLQVVDNLYESQSYVQVCDELSYSALFEEYYYPVLMLSHVH
jgi:hypothetical protein